MTLAVINIAAFASILAVTIGVRVWLSRFIDADHELQDTWDRRQK